MPTLPGQLMVLRQLQGQTVPKGGNGVKAISLLQPWATLVAIGAKKIETRSWATKYRGPLAIHASKGFTKQNRDLCATQPFEDVLFGMHGRFTSIFDLPTGSVIATCRLVDCIKIIPGNLIPQPERSFGDYTPGRYAWILEDVKLLPEPVPAKGSLGLWEWEPEGEVLNGQIKN